MEPNRGQIARAIDPLIYDMQDNEVDLDAILVFLEALTDPVIDDFHLEIPSEEPSGLPIVIPVKEDVYAY